MSNALNTISPETPVFKSMYIITLFDPIKFIREVSIDDIDTELLTIYW